MADGSYICHYTAQKLHGLHNNDHNHAACNVYLLSFSLQFLLAFLNLHLSARLQEDCIKIQMHNYSTCKDEGDYYAHAFIDINFYLHTDTEHQMK